jgi:hypothetical protein
MSFAVGCEAANFASAPPGIAVRRTGVASLAYDPVVYAEPRRSMDCRIKSGNDDGV